MDGDDNGLSLTAGHGEAKGIRKAEKQKKNGNNIENQLSIGGIPVIFRSSKC
jgi:hypothetical protein